MLMELAGSRAAGEEHSRTTGSMRKTPVNQTLMLTCGGRTVCVDRDEDDEEEEINTNVVTMNSLSMLLTHRAF